MHIVLCMIMLGHNEFWIRERATIGAIEDNDINIGRIALRSCDPEIRMRGQIIFENCNEHVNLIWYYNRNKNVHVYWVRFWLPKYNHKFIYDESNTNIVVVIINDKEIVREQFSTIERINSIIKENK